ncbi:Serine/threonine-protein kinase PLK4-like [Oopsacas minuta]|uniref:Serine/threonine-protein kinase PLK4-like n=1 Tax=Oopsacas minuta TaxID=111878 RepID=A0AAV7K308_9METZ|nr:Serine/threonine-protein kinase PLK4-like [Oopsacas minuta]
MSSTSHAYPQSSSPADLSDVHILHNAQLLVKEPWTANNEGISRGAKIKWLAQICRGRKLQKDAFILNPNWQEDILVEVRILQKLQHTSLCHYLGLFFPPGSTSQKMPYFVYENIGYPLNLYLYENGAELQPRVKSGIALDICSGLSFLHSRQVVHRGMCPEAVNIYQSGDFMRAKITDLGVARCISVTAQLIGSKHQPYIPLEGKDPDYTLQPSWDVYSFGILVLELLTQEKPLGVETFIVDPQTKHQDEKFIKVSPTEHIHMLLRIVMKVPMYVQYGYLIQECVKSDYQNRPLTMFILEKIQEMPIQQEMLKNQLNQRGPTKTNTLPSPLQIDKQDNVPKYDDHMQYTLLQSPSTNGTTSFVNPMTITDNLNLSMNHKIAQDNLLKRSLSEDVSESVDKSIGQIRRMSAHSQEHDHVVNEAEDFIYLSQYLRDNRHRKLPTTFGRCIALIHDNKLVLYEITQGEMYVLEPKTQQWNVLADKMPVRLGGICVYGSRLYVLGGFIKSKGGYENAEQNKHIFWCKMTDKDNKVVRSDLPDTLYCHKVPSVAVYNDFILVIGGDTKRNSIEVYDPRHDHWYLNTYIPSDSRGSLVIMSACVRENLLYLALTDERSPPTYMYSSCLDTLSQVKNNTLTWNRFNSRIPTCSPRLISSKSKMYAVGGGGDFSRTSYAKDVYGWDEDEDTWVKTTSLKQERKCCGVCTLFDGSIYVAGGNSYMETPDYLDIQELALIH